MLRSFATTCDSFMGPYFPCCTTNDKVFDCFLHLFIILHPFFPIQLSAELMAMMQEMIKKEVRSYMTGLNKQTGAESRICMGMNMGMGMGMRGEDEFREVVVKRIRVSRID